MREGKNRSNERKIYRIVVCGIMAALVYVLTAYIRFPIGESKSNFANGISLLAGLLFGGPLGGVAAGLGSALSDVLHGYSLLDIAVTFVSKFLMAFVAGVIYNNFRLPRKSVPRAIIASVTGALLYVALYMLKTLLFQLFLYGNTFQGALVVMGGKLPGSLINAVVAVIFAPILNEALRLPLKKIGLFDKLK